MNDWRPLVEVLSSVHPNELRGGPVPPEILPQRPLPQKPPQAFTGQLQSVDEEPPSAPQEPPPSQVLETQKRAAYEEGMALARQEAEGLALRYRESIDQLTKTREQVIRQCEADLVRLALTIAREVLMADVPARHHFTQRMVEQALAMLGDAQSITFRIAPQDFLLLKQHKPELVRRHGIQWNEDPSIELGGIVVEAERGRMDATLAGRLHAMAQKLLGEAGGPGA